MLLKIKDLKFNDTEEESSVNSSSTGSKEGFF